LAGCLIDSSYSTSLRPDWATGFGHRGRSRAAPAVPIFDVSLFKTFRIKESLTRQLRAEAFDFVNNLWFGAPNTPVGSAAFGVGAQSQIYNQRNVHLALKLVF
jgi:hypothetical protein